MSDPIPDVVANARNKDDHGRFEVGQMNDRELAEETVLLLRSIVDLVNEFTASPMMKAMASGKNPIMAMFGK